MRNSVILFSMLSLVACGDPLADFERIENIELAEDTPEVSVLPDPEDVTPRIGVLSRLLQREGGTDNADRTIEEIDPIEAAIATVVEEEKPSGVRGWLRRAAAANAPTEITQAESEIAASEQDASSVDPTDVAIADLVEPEKRRGLLGLLKVSKDDDADELTRTASLQEILPEEAEETTLAEPAKKRGLFGGGSREVVRKGPDAKDVTFGTILPYGEVARVCDAKGQSSLGRRLDKAPSSGRGYALFDSAPDSTGPRTFYVTGFKDKCPRQFTAALALFGSPEVHEQLRYGRPSKLYPYSTTDKAYEKVKSSVCKVGKSKPCGAKLKTLERNTVFVSTYEKFSDNARWADILLHDGVVAAAAIKTP